ncbi:hypothetical protein FNBNMHLP_02196 [Aeromonas jandaei]
MRAQTDFNTNCDGKMVDQLISNEIACMFKCVFKYAIKHTGDISLGTCYLAGLSDPIINLELCLGCNYPVW